MQKKAIRLGCHQNMLVIKTTQRNGTADQIREWLCCRPSAQAAMPSPYFIATKDLPAFPSQLHRAHHQGRTHHAQVRAVRCTRLRPADENDVEGVSVIKIRQLHPQQQDTSRLGSIVEKLSGHADGSVLRSQRNCGRTRGTPTMNEHPSTYHYCRTCYHLTHNDSWSFFRKPDAS